MVKCKKCHRVSPCGCSDTPFTTNYNYISCSSPDPCSEYLNTSCIIYNGPELTGLNVIPGMNLNQVIQAMYLYNIDPACITTTCHSPFVSILGQTNTSINVAWATVAEAASYTIRYREITNPASSFTVLLPVSNSLNNFNITNLTCGKNYEIIVQANFSSSDCDSISITASTLVC